MRNSFSRLKKKAKHLGGKLKHGRIGNNADGGSVDPANPPSQPEPLITADGGEGDRVNTDGQHVYSTGQPLQPDEPGHVSVSPGEIGQGGGRAGVDERDVSQGRLHPHSDIGVLAGSGAGWERDGADEEEVEQTCSSPFAPTIPHGKEPNGMRIWLLQLLSLIAPLDN